MPTPTLISDFEKIIYTGLVSAGASVLVLAVAYFTNFRAKTKEIKLSSYYKDRIEAVKTLYGLIVELNYANAILFSEDSEGWRHETYKSALINWLSAFKKLSRYYNENRILLLEKNGLSNKVRTNLNQLLPLYNAVRKEYNELVSIENNCAGELQYHYKQLEAEEHETKEMRERLKGDSDVNYIISSFDLIREDLESYFKNLVS